MDYKCGEICINRDKFDDFLTNILGEGEYSTFDILKEYQGCVKRNEGIDVGSSWNAHFGKILKQCENYNDGKIIKEISKKQQIIIDGGKTNTSFWKVF